jgi:hypothetical protein
MDRMGTKTKFVNNVMVRSYTNLVFVPIRSINGSVGVQMV